MSRHPAPTLLALALLLLLAAPSTASEEACAGLTVAGGTVSVGATLPANPELPGNAGLCVQAIGKRLASMTSIRTVTVSVRMPDAERLEGNALAIAEAYAKALADAGVPASRVSAVAPAAPPGAAATVSIGYTERRATKPVALAESVGGTVKAGASTAALSPLAGGATLSAHTWIESALGGRAVLGLSDGSRIRVDESSLVQIGAVHLNDDLRRVVQLDVRRGHVEILVQPGGDGSSFDVTTRHGTAGVRGTNFRVKAEEESMELSTLEGLVELDPPQGDNVDVPAGMRSKVDASGKASAPEPMLPAPGKLTPQEGALSATGTLKWSRISGANLYVVSIARDADFTLSARDVQAWTNKLGLQGDLEPGKWFWRVEPRDRYGHAGTPSRIYAFTIPE